MCLKQIVQDDSDIEGVDIPIDEANASEGTGVDLSKETVASTVYLYLVVLLLLL